MWKLHGKPWDKIHKLPKPVGKDMKIAIKSKPAIQRARRQNEATSLLTRTGVDPNTRRLAEWIEDQCRRLSSWKAETTITEHQDNVAHPDINLKKYTKTHRDVVQTVEHKIKTEVILKKIQELQHVKVKLGEGGYVKHNKPKRNKELSLPDSRRGNEIARKQHPNRRLKQKITTSNTFPTSKPSTIKTTSRVWGTWVQK